jgi:hypothetical protein
MGEVHSLDFGGLTQQPLQLILLKGGEAWNLIRRLGTLVDNHDGFTGCAFRSQNAEYDRTPSTSQIAVGKCPASGLALA